MWKRPLKYFSIETFVNVLFCHFRGSNRESSFSEKQRLLDARFDGHEDPSHFAGTFQRASINSKASPPFLLITYCLLLTAYSLIGCAPKAIAPVPIQYREEFSLDEIISRVGKDIETLKAVADIRIEKNGDLYDQANASVILKKPGLSHIRMYKFGMLVGDIVMKDGSLYVLSGKGDSKTGEMINQLFHAVFWWNDLEQGILSMKGDTYIIRTLDKDIHLDRATLLPLFQDIYVLEKVINIKYKEPHDYDGFWYPSRIEITIGDLKFYVKIDKLLINPVLGEFDFKVPVEG